MTTWMATRLFPGGLSYRDHPCPRRPVQSIFLEERCDYRSRLFQERLPNRIGERSQVTNQKIRGQQFSTALPTQSFKDGKHDSPQPQCMSLTDAGAHLLWAQEPSQHTLWQLLQRVMGIARAVTAAWPRLTIADPWMTGAWTAWVHLQAHRLK